MKISRLNIEISDKLQKELKSYASNKGLSIKNFITNLIEKELTKPNDISYKNNNFSKFSIAIICGGPSKERGISLNSARSVADHLDFKEIEIKVYYMDSEMNFFKIERSQLYSNTPSDFDFKLKRHGEKLSNDNLIKELKNVSIVFPLIHGSFGEDGELQAILEENNIPFIGASSKACKKGFNKISADKILKENGFFAFPSISFNEDKHENSEIIKRFFDLNKLKKAVVKPANGGSSIGVYCVYSYSEAIEKTKQLFSENLQPVVIEPFCKGREFTTIILQSLKDKQPVALIPSEIEMKYENYQIFDYRRKYLPSAQTSYYTPPRFNDEEIEKIRKYSENIFNLFKFNDIVRIDGWLLDDGRIWFSDINIAPGMEQNSFVFQQSTRCGLNHSDLIQYIVKSACNRYGIKFPKIEHKNKNKKIVNVLFGGDNAERQVSLMSGTNVWLKLQKSEKYESIPYLLDKNFNVWYLPYMYCLNHTVEEIIKNCMDAENNSIKLKELSKDICTRLDIDNFEPELPKKYSFNEFIEITKNKNALVFLGLHGGKGEDGTIQKLFDENNIKYNGSDEFASKLGMDKYRTGEVVKSLKSNVLITAPKKEFYLKDLIKFNENDYLEYWKKITSELNTNNFIIKPARDGSSAGAVRIFEYNDLKIYIELLKDNAPYIPVNTFKNQKNIIEMPSNTEQPFLLEAFIETDDIITKNSDICYIPNTGWIELTVGVIEKSGVYHSFNPSITIAEERILSVEEKFQGGTGINITPPPSEIMSKDDILLIKDNMEKVAKVLKIKNYARIDIFFNTIKKKIILIETNTLPALTPSTVIYHQALAEEKPINPKQFLELLIDNADK